MAPRDPPEGFGLRTHDSGARVFDQLLKTRYIAIVIVVLSLLHAVAFLVLGTKGAIKAYGEVLTEGADASRPGLELLHSLDYLFVSLVLLILALGIAKLFLLDPTKEHPALPTWLRLESISELKVLLWETVLTTLLIVALSDLVSNLGGTLQWNALVEPGGILILALSLFFMKRQ
jgi:uncharacterized membrane protein YqhA